MIGTGYRANHPCFPTGTKFLQKLCPRSIARRKRLVRAVFTDTSGGDGGSGGGGSTRKHTASDGDRYDQSENPLGLLTLAVSVLAPHLPLARAHAWMALSSIHSGKFLFSRGGTNMQIAGSLTAYQVKDILEEPFWLEDTQLKSVSIIVPVSTS